jgi:WD40 repeat protein
MATLSTLPNEIISIIVSHFDRPQDLLHLALTSKRLSNFAILDGWKALLKGRFHISGLDTDARNSVHGLTTLYRNWRRKGFIARYLEPSIETTSLNTWEPAQWRGPRGQTMGYQPSIDSYEETLGLWKRRREVLTWSAGTQIVMRVKESGSKKGDDTKHNTKTIDSFGHVNTWYSYKIPDGDEGRDDITSLRLLRPHQKEQGFESMVFGTASGLLTRLDVDAQQSQTIEQNFDTLDRSVGALTVSSSGTPLLAATLGDTSLSLFPLDCDVSEQDIEAVSEVTPTIQGGRTGRIWSCNFLSDDKVAIGIGPSSQPAQVYQITADGFLSDPYRSLSLGTSRSAQTSIYPILPVSGHNPEAGNVFLSGGYDGIVRLHDLRSPRDVESLYWDPTNDSSIYSLATQGLERIIVGVSMHSMLKVFDLRLAGSHAYHSISLPTKKSAKPRSQDYAANAIVSDTKDAASAICGGWNLYLNPRVPPKRDAYREDYWRRREDSPVYSLSIPSATSPNLYAGLEGSIQALTFHGIADPYPDTLLSQSAAVENGTVDVAASYNPRGDALNLGVYEQGSAEGVGMHLLVQDDVSTEVAQRGSKREDVKYRGLDERWKDLRDEKDRWTRGVPQGPRQGNRGGRGGRGRGSGRGRGGRGA